MAEHAYGAEELSAPRKFKWADDRVSNRMHLAGHAFLWLGLIAAGVFSFRMYGPLGEVYTDAAMYTGAGIAAALFGVYLLIDSHKVRLLAQIEINTRGIQR